MKGFKKLALAACAVAGLCMSLSGCMYYEVEMYPYRSNSNFFHRATIKTYWSGEYTGLPADTTVDGHGYALQDEDEFVYDVTKAEGLGSVDPYVTSIILDGELFKPFKMAHSGMQNPGSTMEDHLLCMMVNNEMTVEDIYERSESAQVLMADVAQQYKNGSASVKQSIIDKYAPRYILKLHFEEPVTVLMGDEYVTVSGNDCTVDIGQAMKDGGANIAVVSTCDGVKYNHDFVMQRTQEILDMHSYPGVDKTFHDPATGALSTSTAAASGLDFTDVAPNAWYYKAVQYAVDNGVMSGYGGKKFGPNDQITFAQMAQIMYNHSEDKWVSEIGALDLNHWANTAVNWAYQRNLYLDADIMVNGKIDAASINRTMTREQAIAIMARYASFQDIEPESTATPSIPDLTSIDAKYRDEVVRAYQYGITTGVDRKGTFSPKGSVTRAQMCQMFYNMGW